MKSITRTRKKRLKFTTENVRHQSLQLSAVNRIHNYKKRIISNKYLVKSNLNTHKYNNSSLKRYILFFTISTCLFMLYCSFMFLMNKSTVQSDEILWDQDIILNEENREMDQDEIYKHLKFNPNDKFITSGPDVEIGIDNANKRDDRESDNKQPGGIQDDEYKPCFRPNRNQDIVPPVESLEAIKDELLEDYEEYKGKLYMGNLIKKNIWMHLKYLYKVIAHSEVTKELYYDHLKVYSDYSPDKETIKQLPNYEKIHKIVEQWVDQDLDVSSAIGSEMKREFSRSLQPLMSKERCRFKSKGTSDDMNKTIDELLDHIHEYYDKYKSDLKNYKLWTAKGFFSGIKHISRKYQLNLEPKLHLIMKEILELEMREVALSHAVYKRNNVNLHVADLVNYDWTAFCRREDEDGIQLMLMYDMGEIMPPEIQKRIANLLVGKHTYVDLYQVFPEIKKNHKAELIEYLSLALTESSSLFETRLSVVQDKLTKSLFEYLSKD